MFLLVNLSALFDEQGRVPMLSCTTVFTPVSKTIGELTPKNNAATAVANLIEEHFISFFVRLTTTAELQTFVETFLILIFLNSSFLTVCFII